MHAMIGLRSGGVVTYDGDDVDLSQWTLHDFWYGMKGINRFSGQTRWTVLDHVLVGDRWLESKDLRRTWFVHEAAEALGLSDVNFSIKRALGPGIPAWEDGICQKAYTHFFGDLPGSSLGLKEMDLELGNNEVCRLFPPEVSRQMLDFYGFEHPKTIYELVPPNRSFATFQSLYKELCR